MAELKVTEVSAFKVFEGWQKVYSHESKETKCKMTFGIYLPPQVESQKCPVLYWLSGLTCNEQNFITKSGFQRYAAEHGLIVVNCDTSPRGCNIEGEDDDWDFGTNAGFYVDATVEKWKTNYRMYSYVTKELQAVVNANFPVTGKQAVVGHSMGGSASLVISLRNPKMFTSTSAFGPIYNAMESQWGKKAFSGYLGDNKEDWKKYDACHLVRKYKGPRPNIRIEQGTLDHHLAGGTGQLHPESFAAACDESKIQLDLVWHEGYDHNYYFISTFIGEHIKYHAKYLKE